MISASSNSSGADWIQGQGEMAGRIRGLDWRGTPLGSQETWPETLKTVVNVMLASPSPMQIFWGDELLVLYNDAMIPMFSSKHPGCLGAPAPEVWQEAWPLVQAQVERVMQHAEAFNFSAVLVPTLRDGKLVPTYFDYNYSPILGPRGEVLGLLDIARDVTDSVLTERRVEQILESTTDGMFLVNREWRFDFFNARARLLAKADRDLTGEMLWECFPGALTEGSAYVYHYERAMYEGIAGEFFAEYGEPLNLQLKIIVRPVETGILVIFRDVTAEKQAQAALLQNEKLAAVGKLAASIAHEINNPLESVTNLLYLARYGEASELQTYLSLAERELRRVTVIANQTLRFYKQSTRPMAVSCGELFGSVLNIYQGRLVNSSILVEKRKRAHEPVRCFEGEIRQVLTNLVGNAIDAMHPDGGRLLVRSREGTDWRTGRRGLVLTVADTGCGMSAVTLRKLFEAFYTTKGIGGTGLGLWVSREIVDRHAGRLLVRSREGAGTVFALFLPFEAVIRTAETVLGV